jgi:hypothetical protein
MVFNTTFNNISVKSWRSVLLVEETGGNPKKTTNLSHVTDKKERFEDTKGVIRSRKSKKDSQQNG